MAQILQLYSHSMGILSGLIFWAGFFICGIIAYKYSKVFNKQTFYLFMMLAPSGMLLYSILLIIKISFSSGNPMLNDIIQIIAYIFFVLSTLLTLIAIFRFNSILNMLIKYKGEEK